MHLKLASIVIVNFKHIIQQAFVWKVQNDFAEAFGNAYPLCETVKHGLQLLLDTRYNGSQEDFTTKFVQPTLELLRSLKATV